MRGNGWATPAWDADSDVDHPSRHPINQIGQSITGESANNHGGRLSRSDRSFGHGIRVAPSTTQGNNVAD